MQELNLPGFVNHLVPITEFSFKTETSNFDESEHTTGTINPGLLYVADKYQLGVEAIIPINRSSGDGVGVIGNLHFFQKKFSPTPWESRFLRRRQENIPSAEWSQATAKITDAPRHARDRGPFPYVALAPHVSERS